MLGMSFLFAFKFGQTYACTEIYKSHRKILKCCVQKILNRIYFPLSEILKEEIILNVCKINILLNNFKALIYSYLVNIYSQTSKSRKIYQRQNALRQHGNNNPLILRHL